jgi:hypothetical protein
MTLAPGEHTVVVRNETAFRERYGPQLAIAGVYTGNLNSAGERLILAGPLGELVQDFVYDDAWHPTTDGSGRSLVVTDADSPSVDPSDPSAWRASHEIDGSPGEKDLIAGDVNEDDRVDLVDLALLQAKLGLLSATRADGDFNRSGSVDRTDAAMLGRNFGRAYLPPGPSPAVALEPSASARPRLRASRLAITAVDRAHAHSVLDPVAGNSLLTARALRKGPGR